jgi:hypothetical protein
MKHNVKAGDAFMFGGLRWEVEPKYKSDAAMFRSINEEGEYMRYLLWAVEDADSLDWIKSKVTFTQEQVEVLKGQIQHILCNCKNDHDAEDMFIDFLDSHTEEDKPLE